MKRKDKEPNSKIKRKRVFSEKIKGKKRSSKLATTQKCKKILAQRTA